LYQSRDRITALCIACERVVFRFNHGEAVEYKKGSLIYIPKGINYKITFYGEKKEHITGYSVTYLLRNIKGVDYFYSDDITLITEDTPAEIIRVLISPGKQLKILISRSLRICQNLNISTFVRICLVQKI